MSDDTTTSLKDAIGEFRGTFETTGGNLLVSEDDGGNADESSPEQDAVKRYVPKPDAKPVGQ
jgi:hypothetical protein